MKRVDIFPQDKQDLVRNLLDAFFALERAEKVMEDYPELAPQETLMRCVRREIIQTKDWVMKQQTK